MKTQQQIEELAEKEYPIIMEEDKAKGYLVNDIYREQRDIFIRAYTQAQEDMKAGNGVTQDDIKHAANHEISIKFGEVHSLDSKIRKHSQIIGFEIGANWALSQVQSNADELAVGFSEWCDNNYWRLGNTSNWKYNTSDVKTYTTTDLLDIYKEEKGIKPLQVQDTSTPIQKA